MSSLSARLSLTYLTTVQRDANAGTLNARGNPSSPDWQDYLTDVPCRLAVGAGQEVVDAITTAVVEDIRLFLALGVDVTERDQLGDITYQGATILAAPIGIRAVLPQQDHLELVLVRIS